MSLDPRAWPTAHRQLYVLLVAFAVLLVSVNEGLSPPVVPLALDAAAVIGWPAAVVVGVRWLARNGRDETEASNGLVGDEPD